MVVVYYREEIWIQINQGKEVQRAESRKVPSVDASVCALCSSNAFLSWCSCVATMSRTLQLIRDALRRL